MTMEMCITLVTDLNMRIQTAFGTALVCSAWEGGVAGLLASICKVLVVRETWSDQQK